MFFSHDPAREPESSRRPQARPAAAWPRHDPEGEDRAEFLGLDPFALVRDAVALEEPAPEPT